MNYLMLHSHICTSLVDNLQVHLDFMQRRGAYITHAEIEDQPMSAQRALGMPIEQYSLATRN